MSNERQKEPFHMPKISKNASVTLSLICCGIGFLGLIGLGVLLPVYLPAHGGLYGETMPVKLVILIYLCLVPIALADGLLVRLLLLVKGRQVFTDRAVSCLRTISWCCFLEAGLLLLGVFYFYMMPVLAFVAGFLGLVLRVVKNVIEEAVALKAENDFTI